MRSPEISLCQILAPEGTISCALPHWTNVARFQFKNEGDRWQTRGVIANSFGVFIFSEHGIVEVQLKKVFAASESDRD